MSLCVNQCMFASLQILRWNFQTPRSEHVNQLKDQMQPCVSRALHAKLFHEDFKQQLAGISMLTEAIKVEDYWSVKTFS